MINDEIKRQLAAARAQPRKQPSWSESNTLDWAERNPNEWGRGKQILAPLASLAAGMVGRDLIVTSPARTLAS